jgi:hypothetical protein
MFLENLPLQPDIQNITSLITSQSSEITKSVLTSLFEAAKPFLAVVGGLLGLYIIYKILQAISNQLLRKRIKRIDSNVNELNGKVNEILAILNKNRDKEAKKKK